MRSSTIDLPPLDLPEEMNYIGVFLTLSCNLNCSYCINDPEQAGQRAAVYSTRLPEMSPENWIRGLSRLPVHDDLPITLQGGEPMLYGKSKGLGKLIGGLPHHCDLLTNFALEPERFVAVLGEHRDRLQRDAEYPPIRVSYHAEEMGRVWGGDGFDELVDRCAALAKYGFRVAPNKRDSDVGIYVVAHPSNGDIERFIARAAGRVPVEAKEFLGVHDGKLFGTYRYPWSTDLLINRVHPLPLSCECRTTELLLDPLGFVWRCHYFLYESWKSPSGLIEAYNDLEAHDFRFTQRAPLTMKGERLRPLGHLLDPEFKLADVRTFHPCNQYGHCIGCDTKVKNNRFQSYYNDGVPHTSVEIRQLRLPQSLRDRLPAAEQSAPYLAPRST